MDRTNRGPVPGKESATHFRGDRYPLQGRNLVAPGAQGVERVPSGHNRLPVLRSSRPALPHGPGPGGARERQGGERRCRPTSPTVLIRSHPARVSGPGRHSVHARPTALRRGGVRAGGVPDSRGAGTSGPGTGAEALRPPPARSGGVRRAAPPSGRGVGPGTGRRAPRGRSGSRPRVARARPPGPCPQPVTGTACTGAEPRRRGSGEAAARRTGPGRGPPRRPRSSLRDAVPPFPAPGPRCRAGRLPAGGPAPGRLPGCPETHSGGRSGSGPRRPTGVRAAGAGGPPGSGRADCER
jgi:hypothetical protein